MLGCNLHSKHCIVPQPIPMPVQPRFGAPRNPRWRYVIKVYRLNSKTNMNKAKSPCYLLKQCSCLVQEKKMWLPVNDVQSKIQREMFFVLSRAWDKEKKNLSPHEESNLRPPDSALRCSTTEPHRLHGERGLLRSSYDDTRPAYC